MIILAFASNLLPIVIKLFKYYLNLRKQIIYVCALVKWGGGEGREIMGIEKTKKGVSLILKHGRKRNGGRHAEERSQQRPTRCRKTQHPMNQMSDPIFTAVPSILYLLLLLFNSILLVIISCQNQV